MASKGTARLKDVWAMLDDCAQGHSRTLKMHHWWIGHGGKTYWRFPRGDGGEIEVGHLRKLVRFLQIAEECVRKHFPQYFSAR